MRRRSRGPRVSSWPTSPALLAAVGARGSRGSSGSTSPGRSVYRLARSRSIGGRNSTSAGVTAALRLRLVSRPLPEAALCPMVRAIAALRGCARPLGIVVTHTHTHTHKIWIGAGVPGLRVLEATRTPLPGSVSPYWRHQAFSRSYCVGSRCGFRFKRDIARPPRHAGGFDGRRTTRLRARWDRRERTTPSVTRSEPPRARRCRPDAG